MTRTDLIALSPLIVLGASAVTLMLAIAWRRSHRAAAAIAAVGLGATLASLAWAASVTPRQVTPLLVVDGYALFYTGLLCAASLAVTVLAYGYFARRPGQHEELYLLLLLATLGSVVLAGATHFASLFLGLELLSVSLYAMIAYPRGDRRPLEAGVKYLVLAGASSAFLLFGLALIYAETGSMELTPVAALLAESGGVLTMAGLGMLVTGIGFKLALVPFHMWTPDVYAGAPAPVTAFVASVSKGGMFALVLRFFVAADGDGGALFTALAVIAVASMTVGNLLALLQDDVKRLLAYSSIAHLGYLLVALLAGGELAVEAATFYLVAYFVTIVGAFGIVGALAGGGGEPTAPSGGIGGELSALDDYRGLFWRRPAMAAAFTAALLSLAGIPLTAGFLGKLYVLAAGVEASLWALVVLLVANSAVGLFYYLRVVVAMLGPPAARTPAAVPVPVGLALTALTVLLVWFGTYPAPLARSIRAALDGEAGSGALLSALAALAAVAIVVQLVWRSPRPDPRPARIDAEEDDRVRLFLASRDERAWTRAYEVLDEMPETLARSPRVRRQNAFILNRDGKDGDAEGVVRELLAEEGPSAETFGIWGRVCKDRWERAWDAGREEEAAVLLDRTVETYLKGHDTDPSNPYPGINALTMMSFYPAPPERRASLLREVTAAVAARKQAADQGYWDFATRIELAVHVDDENDARAALAGAQTADKVVWMVETTLRNLGLLRIALEERGEPVPAWLDSVEAALRKHGPPPSAPAKELHAVNGIGPKISGLLRTAGILTLEQLAETDVSRLRRILDDAGRSYRLADPQTWPRQARELLRTP
jgi:NADH-quinone oxidoreductase subunit N